MIGLLKGFWVGFFESQSKNKSRMKIHNSLIRHTLIILDTIVNLIRLYSEEYDYIPLHLSRFCETGCEHKFRLLRAWRPVFSVGNILEEFTKMQTISEVTQ